MNPIVLGNRIILCGREIYNLWIIGILRCFDPRGHSHGEMIRVV
jgi:hypothetical protein